MKNFVEELRWRGMLHDMVPGTEELLKGRNTKGYIGFDPTADSLGVGNMVQIMTLLHFQQCGHKPIALVGGATGMVGDPSGKSQERNLLNEETLQHNLDCQKKQLEKFLDFNCGENSAEIVNNYDWFKHFNFLDFIRDVGKHISINYMLAKDSVQKRLDTGMSFTEFSYQLVQGYDFYYLWKNQDVKLQMGGSDQWGNIVTGTELIRRKESGEAFALTTPLIKKADGSKFGKSEGGNVWLDPARTSPYQFYQFWLNASDEDAKNFIRIFTLLDREKIETLEAEHEKAPHQRLLQKELAKEITIRVHSIADYNSALEASEILFGKGTAEALLRLSEQDLLTVFQGVPQVALSKSELKEGINIVEFLSDKTNIFPSRGEARKMIEGGGVFVNKEKIDDINRLITNADMLKEKYILAQKGKKNYYLIVLS
ncbi:MAG: tyrosine--tRNA ligase [Bacteroidia bacterium]|nr:tyrosine--tRNA ligase [Bacteroidia bacterium]